jgi:hypothetical protein
VACRSGSRGFNNCKQDNAARRSLEANMQLLNETGTALVLAWAGRKHEAKLTRLAKCRSPFESCQLLVICQLYLRTKTSTVDRISL